MKHQLCNIFQYGLTQKCELKNQKETYRQLIASKKYK